MNGLNWLNTISNLILIFDHFRFLFFLTNMDFKKKILTTYQKIKQFNLIKAYNKLDQESPIKWAYYFNINNLLWANSIVIQHILVFSEILFEISGGFFWEFFVGWFFVTFIIKSILLLFLPEHKTFRLLKNYFGLHVMSNRK